MRCPECNHDDTRVIDSRTSGDTIRRRRECTSCKIRFTTHERYERPMIWIVKKDGRREPYARDKVQRGLVLACRKRPIDTAVLEEMAKRVEKALEAQREQDLPSSAVGEAILAVLREVDEVAYVRFASVYREFERVEEFIEIVRPLKERS